MATDSFEIGGRQTAYIKRHMIGMNVQGSWEQSAKARAEAGLGGMGREGMAFKGFRS